MWKRERKKNKMNEYNNFIWNIQIVDVDVWSICFGSSVIAAEQVDRSATKNKVKENIFQNIFYVAMLFSFRFQNQYEYLMENQILYSHTPSSCFPRVDDHFHNFSIKTQTKKSICKLYTQNEYYIQLINNIFDYYYCYKKTRKKERKKYQVYFLFLVNQNYYLSIETSAMTEWLSWENTIL